MESIQKPLYELKQKKIFQNYGVPVTSMCLTGDNRLACGYKDSAIRVFDLQNFKCDLALRGHRSSVNYISLLSNGCLVSCSDDKLINIWKINKENYKYEAKLKDFYGYIWKVSEISDNRICSCSYDKIIIYKATHPFDLITNIKDFYCEPYSFIELRSKNLIVFCVHNNRLLFWNSQNYEYKGHIENVNCCYGGTNCLVEFDDDRILVGGDNKITVVNHTTFQVETFFMLKKNFGAILSFVTLQNGTFLCGTDFADFLLLNITEAKLLERKRYVHSNKINSLLLYNGDLISCSEDGTVKIWSLE